MDKDELVEKVRVLEEMVLRVQSRNKQLRRKQYLYRGEITGEQAERIRLLLRGHTIDASRVLDFDPSEYVLPNGYVDEPSILWWLDSHEGKWVG